MGPLDLIGIDSSEMSFIENARVENEFVDRKIGNEEKEEKTQRNGNFLPVE